MTFRREIAALLERGWMSTRGLSVRVKLSEKEVALHLEHIRRSARAGGKSFAVDPWQCRRCGFVFQKRQRLTKPGRCPKCRQGSIAPARFRIFNP